MKIIIIGILLLINNSCKKHDNYPNDNYPIYSGEVKGQSNACNGSPDFPIIIKIYNSIQYDSVYTLTLPTQYWIVGKKLKFKMRELKSGDEYMFCNTSIIFPKQVVVFDVTN